VSGRPDARAALVALGVDADALAVGTVEAAALRPLLAGADAARLLDALGDLPSPAVAALLVALEGETADRAQRKAIRRALYRLSQRGVPTPARATAPAPAAPRPADTDVEGWISAFDGRGERLLWLVRSTTSGALLVAAAANEPGGLRDVRVGETSRKQVKTGRQQLTAETGLRLVPLDWRLVDALLVEAHHRAASQERSQDYLRVRSRITDAPPLAPAEPVSARVEEPAPDERDALVATSVALLEQPEVRAWWPSPEAAAPILAEVAEVRDSPIVLAPLQQEERLEAILRRAAAQLFPPDVTARRLAGTAYVLAETGRVPAARQALAVAAALRAAPAVADVPLLAALVRQGLGALFVGQEQQRSEERQSALVVTPGELRARSSTRRGRTPG
jgi:hypothetical protein